MQRREFLGTVLGAGAACALSRLQASTAPFDLNGDIAGQGAQSSQAFRNQSFGYMSGGKLQRIVWAGFSIATNDIKAGRNRVLLQSASMYPAFYGLFMQAKGVSIGGVAQGKVTPNCLWSTESGGPGRRTNVCEYVDLPGPGAYFFYAQDESDYLQNECSICVRTFGLRSLSIGEQKLWSYVGSTAVRNTANDGTTVTAGSFSIVDPSREKYIVRGCTSNSVEGQTIEVLHANQYALWQQGKPYQSLVTLDKLFCTGQLNGASGNWYMLLKNFAAKPPRAKDPVNMSYIVDRWRRN
jgi:hypothetical protein